MRKNKSYNKIFQKVSAIGMIAALVWLTVSIPFVYEGQQRLKEIERSESAKASKSNSEETNPFANTTEEKTPSTNSLSEEYLHHTEEQNHNSAIATHTFTHAEESLYIAFHGELISPPPDFYFH